MLILPFLIIIFINVIFINLFNPSTAEEMWTLLLGSFTISNFNVIRAIFWYFTYITVCILSFKVLFCFLYSTFYFTAYRCTSIARIFFKVFKLITFVNVAYWIIFIFISVLIIKINDIQFINLIQTIMLAFICCFLFTESIAVVSIIPCLAYKRVDLSIALLVVILGIFPFIINELPVINFNLAYYVSMIITVILSCFIIYNILKKRVFFERTVYNEYN